MDSINYEELAKEVIKQQEINQKEQRPQNHKEVIVSILKEKMATQQSVVLESTQQKKPQQSTITPIDMDLPSYASTAPEASKQEVRDLILFTFNNGLLAGIKKAAKSDPFVIDLYHDALAEHIVTQMKEKGMI